MTILCRSVVDYISSSGNSVFSRHMCDAISYVYFMTIRIPHFICFSSLSRFFSVQPFQSMHGYCKWLNTKVLRKRIFVRIGISSLMPLIVWVALAISRKTTTLQQEQLFLSLHSRSHCFKRIYSKNQEVSPSVLDYKKP